MAILISTIVDYQERMPWKHGLYGHFNFYYCRSLGNDPESGNVYMAILIFTIVDVLHSTLCVMLSIWPF